MVKNRPSEKDRFWGARPPRAQVGAPSRRPQNARKVQSSNLNLQSDPAQPRPVAFAPFSGHSISTTYETPVAFRRFPSLSLSYSPASHSPANIAFAPLRSLHQLRHCPTGRSRAKRLGIQPNPHSALSLSRNFSQYPYLPSQRGWASVPASRFPTRNLEPGTRNQPLPGNFPPTPPILNKRP